MTKVTTERFFDALECGDAQIHRSEVDEILEGLEGRRGDCKVTVPTIGIGTNVTLKP